MGIIQKSGQGSIAKRVAEFQANLEKAAIYMFSYLGEKLAKYAKDNHTYQDQTGNLTNSIGYAIVVKGKVKSYGGEIQPGDGAAEGLKVAMEMAKDYPNSVTLLLVAGMSYASYVEAKGYNVIVPAYLLSLQEFPKYMQRLTEMARKKAQQKFNVNI